MKNYIVSARKHRPETFGTVIGQPSITTTLKNAISGKQLAHAYLFCGPRGVGKTTCARIFAKTINCFDISESTEACNECESCKSFITSRSFNIHELDAASNNSVDDIRNLIDQVRIPPQVGKYSIYIIDEVHMLSANAFNAFLKTLEEPPAHAIFILATTEKYKILPTILSRCQIFDFNRIKVGDIVVHLERIAVSENIDTEKEGLSIIALKADGSMRDALSIFDQIASFSAGRITYQNVIDNLNVLDYDYYFRLTEAMLEGNLSSALMIFNEVLEKGFDGHNFINGLSSHFRDLLVCRDEITLQLLEVGAAIREKYKTQAKLCSPDFLVNSLSITNRCDLSFRSSKNQRLHVELCLIKLCSLVTAEKKNPESVISGQQGIKSPPPGEKPIPVPVTQKTGPAKKLQEKQLTTQEESGSEKPEEGTLKSQEIGPSKLKDTSSAANSDALTGNHDPAIINTLSIKNILNGTAKGNQGPGNENLEVEIEDESFDPREDNEDFTEKDLADQWRKFANQIRDEHPRLYNALMSNKPEITGKSSIRFGVSNPLQQEALNKIRPGLLGHLKSGLSNNLSLEIYINQIDAQQETRLYSQEDKYEYMLNINSWLGKFRQKFNLDFE